MPDSDDSVLNLIEDATNAEEQLKDHFDATHATIDSNNYGGAPSVVNVRLEFLDFDSFEAASGHVADLGLAVHGWDATTDVTFGVSTESRKPGDDDDTGVRAWVNASFDL